MKNSLKIIEIYNNLEKVNTPKNTNILDPYSDKKVQKIYRKFYKKYFHDSKRRIILFGINPGRLGGGITEYHLLIHIISQKNVRLKII